MKLQSLKYLKGLLLGMTLFFCIGLAAAFDHLSGYAKVTTSSGKTVDIWWMLYRDGTVNTIFNKQDQRDFFNNKADTKIFDNKLYLQKVSGESSKHGSWTISYDSSNNTWAVSLEKDGSKIIDAKDISFNFNKLTAPGGSTVSCRKPNSDDPGIGDTSVSHYDEEYGIPLRQPKGTKSTEMHGISGDHDDKGKNDGCILS